MARRERNHANPAPGIQYLRAYRKRRALDPGFVERERDRSRNAYQRRKARLGAEELRRLSRENYHKYAERTGARKYGITPDRYKEILEKQNGKCAICGSADGGKRGDRRRRLAVDHCHATGKVRGMLCASCNAGLGALRDSPELLAKALVYLLSDQRAYTAEAVLKLVSGVR